MRSRAPLSRPQVTRITLTTALLLTLITPALQGQNTPPPPPQQTLEATVPSVTVEPGALFTLPVLLSDPLPIPGFLFLADTNPTQLQFLSIAPGAGIEAHTTANGAPPVCDLIADPGSCFALWQFLWPLYDVAVYGEELLLITVIAPPTAGTYPIDWFLGADTGESAGGTALITVAAPPDAATDFERGDVNDDGACNLGDPIALLGHLFAGLPAPNCYDAADVDDDCVVGLADAVNLLSAVFGTGFPLDESCQPDLTEDSLGACERAGCAP